MEVVAVAPGGGGCKGGGPATAVPSRQPPTLSPLNRGTEGTSTGAKKG